MSADSPAAVSQSKPPFPPAWRTVSFGTNCLMAGALLITAGFLALAVLVTLNMQLFSQPHVDGLENRDRTLPLILLAAGFLVLLCGALLVQAGLCLCCAAPSESSTRPLAMAAAVCWLLFLVIALQIPLAPMVGVPLRSQMAAQVFRQGVDPQPITFVNVFGFTMASLVFAVAGGSFAAAFLCGVANHFHNERLAIGARMAVAYQIVAQPGCAIAAFIHGFMAENWTDLPWYWIGAPCAFCIVVIIGFGVVQLWRVFAETRRMLRAAEEIATESA